MASLTTCVGMAILGLATADTFVFDARNCNTDGDNTANYATSSVLSYSGSGPFASGLQFAGADGDVASHTFQPINMLLNAGNYAVGELELPDGLSIEFADGMNIEVSSTGATASPAIFTGGQFVKPECDANCMTNWLKYTPSAQNPAAQPQMNPTIDYGSMPTATELPCLNDDVNFHHSSSYAIQAYGTQMFNSINFRDALINNGSASGISSIRGGDTMYAGANASAACQAMGMTDASCICVTSCSASSAQRNSVRNQVQTQAEATKQQSAILISGDACGSASGAPETSSVSFLAGVGMLQSDIYALTLGPNLAAVATNICQTIKDETCVSDCTINDMPLVNPQGSISRRNSGLASEVFNITLTYVSPAPFDATQVSALTAIANAALVTFDGIVLARCMSLEAGVDYSCVETEVKNAAETAYDGTKSIADITSELETVYKNARGCNVQELGGGMCSYADSEFSVVGGYDADAKAQMDTIIASALAAVATTTKDPTTKDPNLAGQNSDENDSSSSIPVIPIAAAAGGVLIIIIVLVLVTRKGGDKDDGNDRDVVAFQNPMYDSPEEKHNPVADSEGLYDDPKISDAPITASGGGYMDVAQETNDLYDDGNVAEPNDDSAGLYDDGTGDGGYLDVAETAEPDDEDDDVDEDDEDDDEDDEDDEGSDDE
eukprot:m.339741 g.339741  ORF g.339741 m.339741 type:complete len:666 (-) comp20586_c0_seq1:108-2105(-)